MLNSEKIENKITNIMKTAAIAALTAFCGGGYSFAAELPVVVPEGSSEDKIDIDSDGENIKGGINIKGNVSQLNANFNNGSLNITGADDYASSTILSGAGGLIETLNAEFSSTSINVRDGKNMAGALVKSIGEITSAQIDISNTIWNGNGQINGGLVEIDAIGKISNINNSHFNQNNITVTSGADITGGIFENSGTLGSMNAVEFANNTARSDSGVVNGGVFANLGTVSDSVQNTTFNANTASSDSGDVKGGAIYNTGIFNGHIVNSTFTDNAAKSKTGTALGGAIYTTTDLYISGENGGTTRFQGNYVTDVNGTKQQAIYVDSRIATLTLNASNNGKILVYDNINGFDGYNLVLSGDSTGKIGLYGNITNANVIANGGNIDFVNSVTSDFNFGQFVSSGEAKYSIDLNIGTGKADTFTVGTGATGLMVIDRLNILGDLPDIDKQIKILNSPSSDTVSITLSDSAISDFSRDDIKKVQWNDDVPESMSWGDTLYKYERNDTIHRNVSAVSSVYGGIIDSIQYTVTTTEGSTISSIMGDTLRIMNQANSDGVRTYTANAYRNTHTVTEDLGSTGTGTFSVIGVEDPVQWNITSKIDADNHTLFKVDKASTLNLSDILISNAKNEAGSVLNITNPNAVVNLSTVTINATNGTNAIINNGTLNTSRYITLHTGITGTGTLNLKDYHIRLYDDTSSITQSAINIISGELFVYSTLAKLNANINISNSGILNVYASNIGGNIVNNGVFKAYRGDLDYTVSGTGRTEIWETVNANKKIGTAISLAKSGAVLNISADNVGGGITQTVQGNTINLSGGTLNHGIDVYNSNININGDVISNARIRGKLNVTSGSSLTIAVSNCVGDYSYGLPHTIDGTLHLKGNGNYTSAATIGGSGTIHIMGNISFRVDTPTDNQDVSPNILIDGDGVLTSSASRFRNGTITNNNILNLTEGSLSRPLTGTGITNITGGVINNVNLATRVDINKGGILTTNAGNIGNTISNSGELVLTGGTLTREINGTGTTTFTSGTTTLNAAVNQAMTTKDAGGLIANADFIGGNLNGSATLTGGTLNYRVSGSVNVAADTNLVLGANGDIGQWFGLGNNATATLRPNQLHGYSSNLSPGSHVYLIGTGSIDRTWMNSGTVHVAGDITMGLNYIRSGPVIQVDKEGIMTLNLANPAAKNRINNYGLIKLSGTLDRNIYGEGTTNINNSLAFGANSGISGTLNFNNGTLNLSDRAIKNFNVGKLAGSGTWALDMDNSTGLADTLTLSAASNAVITPDITLLNVNGPLTNKVFQILKGEISGVQLQLPDVSQGIKVVNREEDFVTTPDVNFNDRYEIRDKTGTATGSLSLAQTEKANDSISVSVNNITWGDTLVTKKDIFHDWLLYDTTEEKNFNFASANDQFNIMDHLYSASITGTVNINGKTDGTKRSILNFGNKWIGFSVRSGGSLNFSNVTLANMNGNNQGANKIGISSGGRANFENVEYYGGHEEQNISNSGTIDNITGLFRDSGASYIFYNGGTINRIAATFRNNFSYNGLLQNSGTIKSIENSLFERYAYTAPGIAMLPNGGTIGRIVDTTFNNNYKNATSALFSNGITLRNNSGKTITTFERNTFTGNYIRSNTAATLADGAGAAIYNAGTFTNGIIDSHFTGNYINASGGHGAAIYNEATIKVIDGSDFTGNYIIYNPNVGKSGQGGAIYNTGTGIITEGIKNSTFDGNYVETKTSYAVSNAAVGARGGAIYNASSPLAIVNSNFLNNHSIAANGLGSATGGALHGAFNITGGRFENNYVQGQGSYTYGGAICIGSGSTISGGTLFKKNRSTSQGGAVAVAGTSVAIDATFEENSASNGGAIVVHNGNLAQLNGTFLNNTASSIGGAVRLWANAHSGSFSGTYTGNYAGSFGGAIANWYDANSGVTLNEIVNATFTANRTGAHGGAIANSGNIQLIKGSVFEGNYSNSNYDGNGGAIYNRGTIGNITNSSFKNNYISAKTTAHGGAIYSNKNLTISATDGGLTEFTGNYVQLNGGAKNYEAIYIDGNGNTGASTVLTLNATNNGVIKFNDYISGVGNSSGYKYKTAITGDETGTLQLFNNIYNSNITANNILIDTRNSSVFNYNFLQLDSSESAKWALDIDLSNGKADNFALGIGSTGIMKIDNLNFIGSTTENKTFQIIKNNRGDVELTLSKNKYGSYNVVDNFLEDAIPDTVYNDGVYRQEKGLILSTTDTYHDSIEIIAHETNYDPLNIILGKETENVRNFTFRDNGASSVIFNVSKNLNNITAGTLNINGLTGKTSVIDAKGYSLFNLTNETNFTVSNVNLTGNENIINVTNPYAIVNLNNTRVTGNIKGEANFKLNLGGDYNSIDGKIVNTTTTLNSGTLTFNKDTFADSGNKLNVTGGTIDFRNDITENYVINDLTSNSSALYNLDMNLNDLVSDTITINSSSASGVVTIGDMNYIGNLSMEDIGKHSVKVLNTTSDSIRLALSEAVTSKTFNMGDIRRDETDEIATITYFDTVYYNRYRLGIIAGKLSVDPDSPDSIIIDAVDQWNSTATPTSVLGDTLQLVAKADMPVRILQANSVNDAYNVGEDIGLIAAGELTISGVSDGKNLSTLNLANHQGFVLGADTTLSINNTNVAGSTTPIEVTDSTAKVELNNAHLGGGIKANTNYELSLIGNGVTTIDGTLDYANATLSKGGFIFNSDTFASSTSSLKVDGGAVYMNDEVVQDYHFNNLVSNVGATYLINADMVGTKADRFIVNSGTGVITLDGVTVIGLTPELNKSYTINVLNSNGNAISLEISDALRSQMKGNYKLGTTGTTIYDTINPVTNWDKIYYKEIKNVSDVYGSFTLNDAKDSIIITATRIDLIGDQRKEGGDTLRLWSQLETSTNRQFNFDSASNVYNVTENLGSSTAGNLSVNGRSSGSEKSTINADTHTLFELSNNSTLNISNIKVINGRNSAGSILNITNPNAKVNINNFEVESIGNKVNGINNAGTLTFTGNTNTINTGISGTSGVLNIDGGAVLNIGATSNITQSAVNINNGSLNLDPSGIIYGSVNIKNSGSATMSAGAITQALANAGNLTLVGGTLAYGINGQGSTSITGDVTSFAGINQNFNITSDGSLTTSADNIGGNVSNANNLILTGGTLTHAVGGAGSTQVKGNVTANAKILQNIDITNEGSLTINASNIAGVVSNAKDLNLTGGVLSRNVSGAGRTNIGGDVTINSSIFDNTIHLNSGVVKLTAGSDISGAAQLNVHGGTIDLQDEGIHNTNLGDLVLHDDLHLNIDIDLANKKSDIINVSSLTNENNHSIIISSIKVLTDATDDMPFVINIADEVLRNSIKLATESVNIDGKASGTSYLVSYSKETGDLTFGYGNLSSAISLTARERQYNLKADENSDLGVENGDNSILTVYGHNYSVNINSGKKWIIGAGKTVNLNDVTMQNADTTAIENSGTLNIKDVQFKNNSKDIKNDNVLTFAGTNSVNTVEGTGSTTITAGQTTVNNTFNQGTVNVNNGAALVNNATGTVNIFTNNGTVTNAGNLTAGQLTNNSGKNLTNTGTLNGTINNSGTIANSGALNLSGGTNSGTIQGNGTTTVTNRYTNTNNFTQSNLVLNQNTTLTNTESGNITVNTTLTNNGTLANAGQLTVNGTNSLGTITGAGTLNVNGTITANKSITQNKVIVSTGSTLTNAGGITSTVENKGTFDNNAILTGTLKNTGSASSSASNLNGNVENTGTLTFEGGTFSKTLSGAGTTIVNGSTTNTGSITQQLVNVKESSALINSGTLSADSLTNSGEITNNNTLSTGNLTNSNKITNTSSMTVTNGTNAGSILGGGSMTINGTFRNDGTITQTTVSNSGTLTNTNKITGNISNTGTINSSADNLVGQVTNNGTLNISGGQTQGNITGSTGTVNVNGNLKVSHNIIGNTLVLGTNTETTLTGGTLNLNGLTANGGSINAQNGTVESISLGNVVLNDDLNISIDADLALKSADTITGSTLTTNGHNIIIDSINVLTDPNDDMPFEVNVTDEILRSAVRLTGNTIAVSGVKANTNYLVTYSSSSGNLTFTYGDLNTALHLTASQRNYTMAADEIVTGNLGVMEDGQDILNINGNNFNIIGNNHEGITVTDNNTLYVNDVHEFKGFTTALKNKSDGIINIKNTTFTGNTTDIENAGKLTFSGTNSLNILIGDSGSTTINNGSTTVNQTLTQHDVLVKGSGTLVNKGTTNVESLTNNGIILNENIINADSLLNNVHSTFTNNGEITTELTNGGTFTNNNSLILNGGTNDGKINGTGSTTISGDFVNNSEIEDHTVIVSEGKTLTNKGTLSGTLNNSGIVDNSNALNLSAGTNSGTIQGHGTTTITKQYTNTNNFTQSNLVLNENTTLTNTESGNVTVNTTLTNDGTISNAGQLTVNGTNSLGTITGAGTLNVNGTITVNKAIIQNKVIVSNGSTLTNAGGITSTVENKGTFDNNALLTGTLKNTGSAVSSATNLNGTVENAGTLTLEGGTFSNSLSGAGTTVIKNTVRNSGTIAQGTLEVSENSTLENDEEKVITAQNLTNSGNISNSGSLNAVNGTNAGSILGDGSLTISGTFKNDGTITQTSVSNSGTLTNSNKITGNISNTGTIDSLANNLVGQVTNNGILNISGGQTQGNISGSTGTINVNGNLDVSHIISGNTLVLNNETQTSITGGELDLNGLTANGGSLNALNSVKDDISLGNVVLNNDLRLSIDADLAGKWTDTISGDSVIAENGHNIVIDSIHILTDSPDRIPITIGVADENLKNNVILGSNFKVSTTDQVKDSYFISYKKDDGTLKFEYLTLPVAVSSETEQKVYVMNQDEYVNEALGQLHGKTLSISGNGNKIIATDDADGITVEDDRTLSLNDLTYTGFGTGITNNNGTVNITDVTFEDNTTDIDNESILNFYGKDSINTVIGALGTTNISSYKNSNGEVINAEVTINEGGAFTQNKLNINVDNKLINKGIVSVDNLSNKGTLDNDNQLTISSGTNSGEIVGTGNTEIQGNFSNTGKINQNTLKVNRDGEFSTNLEKITTSDNKITNDGILNITEGKNTLKIQGDGKTEVKGDVTNYGKIEQSVSVAKDGKLTTSLDYLETDDIQISGQLNVTDLEINKDIGGTSTGVVNVNHSLKINSTITGTGVALNNGSTVFFGDNANLADSSNFIVNNGNINLQNKAVDYINLGQKMTMNGNVNLYVDVDLENSKMDRVSADSLDGKGFINVKSMTLISDAKDNQTRVDFANEALKNNVKTDVKAISYSPIWAYGVDYDRMSGQFVFTKGGTNSNNKSEAFNPAILSSSVTTQIAGHVAMSQTIGQSFQHSDWYFKLPANDRFARLHRNNVAISTDYNGNLGQVDTGVSNQGFWTRPYSSFESINLKNGPKVNLISYGTMVGGDSDFHQHKHGWASVSSAYIGYHGAQFNYKGSALYNSSVSATSNGGVLGLTETFYKNNFFTALSLTAGASFTEVHNSFGKEDIPLLMAGVASKSGYNFEIKEGKFIIQPNLLMSYSFAGAFDSKNPAGVNIDNSPMHTIQLNPSIRFIGNTKGGWQPYATVGVMWNIMNNTRTMADDVELPGMSTKPYIEYGLGLQKLMNDNFSAWGQATVRNGGRNGVAITAGLRWNIGKDNTSNQKVSVPDEKVKPVNNPKLAPIPSVNKPIEKKVIKQLTPKQISTLGLNQKNTTKTSSNGIIKPL